VEGGSSGLVRGVLERYPRAFSEMDEDGDSLPRSC
jgi:hypothetical protein